jgi:hypothetical protein
MAQSVDGHPNEMKIILNVDSTSFSDYGKLSTDDKIKFIQKWSFLTTEFKEKTGYTSTYQAESYSFKGIKKRKMIFRFYDGSKFTVSIGGVRGGHFSG